jgi:hypothetical protein
MPEYLITVPTIVYKVVKPLSDGRLVSVFATGAAQTTYIQDAIVTSPIPDAPLFAFRHKEDAMQAYAFNLEDEVYQLWKAETSKEIAAPLWIPESSNDDTLIEFWGKKLGKREDCRSIFSITPDSRTIFCRNITLLEPVPLAEIEKYIEAHFTAA